jgi:hypothetical protein
MLLLEYGFELVSVGVAHEGRVVGRPIMRAQAGCAFVDAAMPERRCVEGVDRAAAFRVECQMKSGARRGDRARLKLQCQSVAATRGPIAGLRLARPHADIAERAERGIVERDRAGQVGNAERQWPSMLSSVTAALAIRARLAEGPLGKCV